LQYRRSFASLAISAPKHNLDDPMTAMTRHKIATARSPTHTPAHTPPAIQHSSTATTMADEDLREVFLAFCAFGDRANGGRMDGAKVSASWLPASWHTLTRGRFVCERSSRSSAVKPRYGVESMRTRRVGCVVRDIGACCRSRARRSAARRLTLRSLE